jgi:hypothetical protein
VRTGSGDDDAAEEVLERSMPPDYYTWFGLHDEADLDDAERRELAEGLLRPGRALTPVVPATGGPPRWRRGGRGGHARA